MITSTLENMHSTPNCQWGDCLLPRGREPFRVCGGLHAAVRDEYEDCDGRQFFSNSIIHK